jgi:acylphosphatase
MDSRHAPASIETRRLRVRGRVQGVGFRQGCVDAAAAFDVMGWVRNRLDGTVELLVQGPADALDRMQRWLAGGVPAARVLCPAIISARRPDLFEGERRLLSHDERGGTGTASSARRMTGHRGAARWAR